jgi:hypothetical protein
MSFDFLDRVRFSKRQKLSRRLTFRPGMFQQTTETFMSFDFLDRVRVRVGVRAYVRVCVCVCV